MIHDFIASLYGEPTYQVFATIFRLYPIWLPIILSTIFAQVYLRWRRSKFVLDQGQVLLEIKIPREITKSPASMELFLTSLFQTGSASYFETYIDGKVRPWFSLELVSIEGKIHFYIWAQKKFKAPIESQIYAQYPEVEVAEVPDYSLKFSLDPERFTVWASHFILSKDSPIPIKTYIDYSLDQNPKEEFKVDPLTAALEFLGSIGPGEQVWIQILIQAHKKTGLKEGEPHFSKFFPNIGRFLRGEGDFSDIYHLQDEDWKTEIKDEIKKINDKLRTSEEQAPRRPTKGEIDTIAAIERHSGKFPFETMIRGYYIARKDSFNSIRISGLIGSLRQYSTGDLNSFKPGKNTDFSDNWKDFFRYFFKNYGQNKRRKWERRMLEAYKLRSFFEYPYKNHRNEAEFILTTEELATIFHFPGQVAATPGLDRIPSKKGQAPADLPI